MEKLKRLIVSVAVFATIIASFAQKPTYTREEMEHWVDSVFSTLSETEKIGQTMMIYCSSNNEDFYQQVSDYIKSYGIGGVIFMQGNPVTQAKLTNKFQSESRIPLLISQDAEWGPQMRLKDDCTAFPKQMTLGAITDDSLIYQMGKAVATQLLRLGVHVNFAPVVDVNNNPANPVINVRSFGEDKYNVAAKGIMYMKGMQDNKVAAVAKHFPGHGDTNTDSHSDLPVINHSYKHISDIELYPFKQLVNNGVHGIMVAHIYFPQIDSTKNITSSLSKPIVTGILRDSLNFSGLAITDGLNMKALYKYAQSGEIEAYALQAGNDVLLLPADVDKAVTTIQSWLNQGKITRQRLDDACKNVLREKFMLGAKSLKNTVVDTTNIIADLNSPKDKTLIRTLYRNAFTAIKNNNNTLPLDLSTSLKTVCVVVSDDKRPVLENSFGRYTEGNFIYAKYKSGKSLCDSIINKTDKYDRVIVIIASSSNSTKTKFNISSDVYDMIDMLSFHPNSTLCIIANPYLAGNIKNIDNFNAVIFGYEPVDDVFDLLPQCLFGAYPIKGRLPVSINEQYKAGAGVDVQIKNKGVISYPSQDEIDAMYGSFHVIDSLALAGINIKAYPGCQVVAIHKGNVILNKAYGNMTYENNDPVTTETLYDVASITKIMATTLAVLSLQEYQKFDIDKPLSRYLPFLDYSDKKNIIIRDIMAHQARFPASIQVFSDFTDDSYREDNVRETMTTEFSVKVADKMYVKRSVPFHIYDTTAQCKLLSGKKLPKNHYVYSCMGFILLAKGIENSINMPLNEYVEQYYYSPMGLSRTTFLPLEKFSKKEIAPTENDKTFRRQVVRGYVHDEKAALLGGVAGNAGLFSNAIGIGTLMQMLLQDGYYGGRQYIKDVYIKDFTTTQFPEIDNRRALGFDKPLIEGGNNGPVCEEASSKSFGHSGFTGCFTWADPQNELVYVFLSNRIYPDVSNNKISKYSFRSKIHSALYNIVNSAKPE